MKIKNAIIVKLCLVLMIAASKTNLLSQEHEKWKIGHGDLTVDYVGAEWLFSFHPRG